MNYEECVEWLWKEYKSSPQEEQKKFASYEKDDLILLHHELGRYIRNHCDLWKNEWIPELDLDGVDYSPNHPDAISMRVIEAVWEKAKNEN